MTDESKVLPLTTPDPGQAVSGDKYVRVRHMRDDGYVEFDFSIDDPALYVELILPTTAFNEFCNANAVKFLDDDQARAIDEDKKKWRYGYLADKPEE